MAIHEALRISPDLPLAVSLRGELALRSGKLREARALFEQAFVSSRQLRYLIDQARAQDLAGDRDGANQLREQVERLLRKDLADGVGHRLELVEVLLDRGGDLREPLTLAREDVAMRGSVDARFQLARVLARKGDVEEALAQVRTALATGAREAQLYELALRLEAARGNARVRSSTRARLASSIRATPAGASLRRAD